MASPLSPTIGQAPEGAANTILTPRDWETFTRDVALLHAKFPGELDGRLNALTTEEALALLELGERRIAEEEEREERDAALKAEAEALRAEVAAMKDRLTDHAGLESELANLKAQLAWFKAKEEEEEEEEVAANPPPPAATRPCPRGANTEDSKALPSQAARKAGASQVDSAVPGARPVGSHAIAATPAAHHTPHPRPAPVHFPLPPYPYPPYPYPPPHVRLPLLPPPLPAPLLLPLLPPRQRHHQPRHHQPRHFSLTHQARDRSQSPRQEKGWLCGLFSRC
ncbi:unnamed protein product [Vitrella brassicaformis CCMP3155]|uniref:Uncharacterized protein n=1 Tax=Vitrella brassicaformis (strain CCMP3155) TaxID=1169540 RepID=A0A0G4GJB7_VITBC|nr:unnamed protein product [Vitrella brassicaformis CCMP3155]|eukprot:CEM29961.1 unnamed protein product [Vitrella brassicaformis CCMP3155]